MGDGTKFTAHRGRRLHRGSPPRFSPSATSSNPSAGKYNILHVGAEEHIVRETLGSLEKKLPARQFRRTHRSSIVNIDSIKEIQPLFHGDSCLILKTGDKVILSRSYRDKFRDFFGA